MRPFLRKIIHLHQVYLGHTWGVIVQLLNWVNQWFIGLRAVPAPAVLMTFILAERILSNKAITLRFVKIFGFLR